MLTDDEQNLIFDYYGFIYRDASVAENAAEATCKQIQSHAMTFREFALSALKRTDLPQDLRDRFEDAI